MPKRIYKYITGTENRRNTVIVILSSFFSQAILLITGILVARALGPEVRGQLAFLILIPTIFVLVGQLGIPNAITYFIASGLNVRGTLRNCAYILLFTTPFVSLFYVATTYTIAIFNNDYILYFALLFVIAIPATFIKVFVMSIFQGIGNFIYFTGLSLSYIAYYAIGVIFLAITDSLTLQNIVYVWMMTYALSSIQALYLYKTRHLPTGNNEIPSKKNILIYSLRGHFGSISPIETLRIDQLLAIILLDTRLLGLYVVAQAFTNLPLFLSRNISSVVFPGITKKPGKQQQLSIFIKSVLLIFFISSSLSLLLALAMPYLVLLFFGPEFRESIPFAQILLLASVFMATRRVAVELLRGVGMPGVSSVSELIMYPWLLVGGSYLTINYSGIGLASSVAIAYLFSLIVAITYSFTHFKKHHN